MTNNTVDVTSGLIADFVNASTASKAKWTAIRLDEALRKILSTPADLEIANLDRLSAISNWDVLKLQDRLKLLRKHYQQENPIIAQPPKPTLAPEELAEAIEFGKKDLVTEFQEAHKKLGFVGSPFMTRSLIHTTGARLCQKRQGLLYSGRSRSGKSEGLEAQCQLLHPSNLMRATSMTVGSIYQLGELDHLFILAGELRPIRRGEDDSLQHTFRQFISEPEIVHRRLEERVCAEGKKYLVTEHKVTGSAAIVWTSTKDPQTLKDEFALRLITIKSDESPDTTERVQRLKASRAKTPIQTKEVEEGIKRLLRNFDLSLKPYVVAIPFADLIILRNTDTTARAIYQLMLHHIEISALLNQHKEDRKKTDDRCIIATLEDYEAAYELISHGAFQILNTVSKAAKAAYFNFYELWKNRINEPFSHKHVMELLKAPKANVSEWLPQWVECEMIDEDEDNWKNPSRKKYILQPWADSDQGLGLVTPEELRKLLAGSIAEGDCSRTFEMDSEQ